MHMKICRNFGAALCFVGVILWLMAGLMLSVSADSAANSLTLICKTEKVTLTGMHWDLYRVGSRKGGNFVLEGDFAKYPVSLEDMSSSAVTEAAKLWKIMQSLIKYRLWIRVKPEKTVY